MTLETITKELNQRHYFLKLAKNHTRQHDIAQLSREIEQLEFQLTQFLAQ